VRRQQSDLKRHEEEQKRETLGSLSVEVRMPTPEECTPPRSRYSIAFFMQADKQQLIECEEYEPITAGDYILGRIKSNYAKVLEKTAGA